MCEMFVLKNGDTAELEAANIDISQSSVATHLRCGGIFGYLITGNLLLSLPVREKF